MAARVLHFLHHRQAFERKDSWRRQSDKLSSGVLVSTDKCEMNAWTGGAGRSVTDPASHQSAYVLFRVSVGEVRRIEIRSHCRALLPPVRISHPAERYTRPQQGLRLLPGAADRVQPFAWGGRRLRHHRCARYRAARGAKPVAQDAERVVNRPYPSPPIDGD
jgi:hypothetical protein